MLEGRIISDVSRAVAVDGASDEDSDTNDVGTDMTGVDSVLIGALQRTTVSNHFDGNISEVVELSTEPSTTDRNLIGNAFEATRGYTWTDVS